MSDVTASQAARQFSCFAEFTDAEVAAMLPHLEPVQLPAGQNLFHQGEPGDAIYLLSEGEVQIVIDLPGPDDYAPPPLTAGAIFGELAPLVRLPRSGTAVARVDTFLWKLSFAEVRAALGRGESWAGKFALTMAQTLAHRLLLMGDEMAKLLSAVKRPDPAAPRVAEMERVRKRLLTEWSF
jgi:CRP-like cAMP-binding protein